MQTFLWLGTTENKKGGVVAWKTVCKPKNKGRVGIKELKTWNKAVVEKLILELLTSKSSSWAIWVSRNKLKQLSFWEITKSLDASWLGDVL